MIIVRTPLRVSLFGGGTDVPSYYTKKEAGGMVISMAIDKHIYLTAHPMFESSEILLKYSTVERVSKPSDIKHNIFRKMLEKYKIYGVDIGVSSDIPSGTGLGSSSAFTVGLVKLLNEYQGCKITKEQLAAEACEIEINWLGQLIGKQDQYASAFGGLNRIEFLPDDSVIVKSLAIDDATFTNMNKSLLLVKIGQSRSAGEILEKQAHAKKNNYNTEKALDELYDLTKSIKPCVFDNLKELGKLLSQSWELKKRSNPFATSPEIDDLICFGLSNGALGAKLLGAGGAGFVLFLVRHESSEKFKQVIKNRRVMNIGVDFEGSMLIYDNRRGD
jgi:D-glycero-alpha-D-manno-heptose-7-phosphate kinase